MNERLLKILADTLGLDAGSLNDATSMENTPQWDSVAHLNLVLSFEQAFGQRFSPDEFLQMQSVADIKRVFAGHGVS
jgi:acyl carrier protein